MLEFLYQALSAPFGIVLRTNDVEKLRARLYAARKEAQDLDLDNLSLVPSPYSSSELWILRRAPKKGT